MKSILTGAFAVIVSFVGSEATAQFAMDTALFANPVRVDGAIPGLYKWVNSPQSDSADVAILSPTDGQQFKVGDSIFVTVSVSGIAIGAQTQHADRTGLANSAGGQYIGVILDEAPHLTNCKSGEPFFVGLATPGVHTLRVFACRSWHESIKSPGSLKTISFFVGDHNSPSLTVENDSLQPGHPILTWGSPKGEYVRNDAQAIVVDFLVTNGMLGSDGYCVRLIVDSVSTLLTEAVPYLVTGLMPGEHTFKLELISAEGILVGGKLSHAERMVVVK